MEKINSGEYFTYLKTEIINKGEVIEFQFKSKNNSLLAYFKVTIITDTLGGKSCYINDMTTANGYYHFTDRIKKFYHENGYNKNSKIKYFGEIALNEVISHIKNNFDGINIIVIPGLEKNKKNILELVTRTKKRFNHILEVYGPTDNSVCSIRI
ncbi:hypothetical protein EOM39_03215 [Candidatus Gracilibacteria bacterium]|nr:hypothetical protein [Candidatus Gracilibacteria bacterium]